MDTMENTAIIADHISMKFNLAQERTEALKEYVIKKIKRQLHYTEFYALRDVSFSLKKGGSLGIIGRNGSGKSTLLKCIAGVMFPTKGTVTVTGSTAPLIELGAGFDPELTAKENVYLNGAVLGHDRAFMNERFDEIIDFAELWEFVDVPVKNYSSGMYARLGFAIATEIKADVLICDEILSVGDMAFKQKCRKRMEELLSGGTTLLYVGQDPQTVEEMCAEALWLDHGRVREYGDSYKVCGAYMDYLDEIS